ncbi:phage tail tube protein [Longirhabdus pacifica]|uniref:phage tail tube protein n=1 Tax=Longirhabdus pacifica TaxID=2305227 RepID=UPI001F0BC49E|nr:phage tail tube protein [Longirhabdus pacifica]
MVALDASRTINGTFGEVWHDGVWLTNIKSAEATVEINKEEIQRAGTRWVAHKVTGLSGTGTINGYRITTEMIDRIGQIKDDTQGAYTTEILMKLADPESFGAYRVRLKGVQFDSIPLMNYEVGSIVEEELSFTFTGYDILDFIIEG